MFLKRNYGQMGRCLIEHMVFVYLTSSSSWDSMSFYCTKKL